MIVRQLVEAAAAEVEGEIAVVVGDRLCVGLDANRNDRGGNCRHDIREARCLRRCYGNRSGKGGHDLA
ncbi:hypothetical protein D3C80_2010390 [compost metagenome]